MDHDAFDTFTRTLSETGSRRGILGLLATLPVLGGLFALLDSDETDAKGRRKRRKKRHKHGKGRDAGKGKGRKPRKCKPHTLSTTCKGTCGPVKNNCQKTVDCGPCDCDPPCDVCQTCTDDFVCEPCDPCCDDVCCDQPNAICHADSGACCVPDSKAQTCNNQCSDVINNCGVSVDCGPCTCPGGCPACQVCHAETGECIPDPNQEGDDCGDPGQVCQSDGTCSCEASSCPSCTTCENDGFCAPCAGCCDGETCVTDCGECRVCDDDSQCVSCPDCCDSGTCVATCPAAAPICGAEKICVPCETNTACGENALCVDGQCRACDVVDGEVLAVAIGAASAGATLAICPGTYGPISLDKSLTLIGAGQGSDPASNTILDGAPGGTVVTVIEEVTVELHRLRITGGSGDGVDNSGALSLTACTVHDNGGRGLRNHHLLTLTDCTVSENSGGISTDPGVTTLNNTIVRLNTAFDGAGIQAGIIGEYHLTNGSTITENSAANVGGGVFLDVNGRLICDGTGSITGNFAAVGGGIYNDGTVHLNGTPVTGNNPDNCAPTAIPGCSG